MSPIIRVILGLIMMVIGFLVVSKTGKVLEWFGQVPFAEKKFGEGGTRFFYKLLGIGIVFLGVFTATNIISSILEDLAGFLTNT